MEWVRRQFDTRTIVLMPIAIAVNIVLGQTVAAVLKIPIYLDSIGTVLVAVLAGPIPGMVTGLLSNLIWTYLLPAPFNSPYAAPFAIVAVEIGLLAGLFAWFGFFRTRPNTPWPTLIAGGTAVAAIFLIIGYFGFVPFYAGADFTFFGDTSEASPWFVAMGYLIGIGIVAAVIGLFIVLLVRRDVGIAYAAVAGFITGIVSAIISAPISAVVFGGVTGSGVDLLTAAFQQAGSDLQTAVLQQGLISDPIDKTVTFLVVFLILQVLSRRFVARFPQGERIVGLEGGEEDVAGIASPEASDSG
jgi:energy-coupling factor transport system substrate-specific component